MRNIGSGDGGNIFGDMPRDTTNHQSYKSLFVPCMKHDAGCLIRGRRRWSVAHASPRAPNLEFGIEGYIQERKPYQFPGRMKNSPYYIAPAEARNHDLPHTQTSLQAWVVVGGGSYKLHFCTWEATLNMPTNASMDYTDASKSKSKDSLMASLICTTHYLAKVKLLHKLNHLYMC